jgi:hypothetical protein
MLQKQLSAELERGGLRYSTQITSYYAQVNHKTFICLQSSCFLVCTGYLSCHFLNSFATCLGTVISCFSSWAGRAGLQGKAHLQ